VTRDAKKILERVAREERAMRDRELVAPVLPGSAVVIRVSGLAGRLRVLPADHAGWAVLKPDDRGNAMVLREATLSEMAKYLERLPRYRMLLVEREQGRWWGVSAGDGRLSPDALYPLGLVTEGERFEAVAVRFDGASFWFEGPDAGGDPGRAEWLRDQLVAGAAPDALERPGLTPPERRAYAHVVAERARLEEERARHAEERRAILGEREESRRLERALTHAGGRLLRFDPVGDNLAVTFQVDGRERRATVRRADLTVLAAGICLSGRDADFDLATLVTVLREAAENDRE